MADDAPENTPVRYSAVLLTVLAGLVLTVVTFWFAGWGHWHETAAHFMVEVSVAIFLAAGLFLLERTFTRRITARAVQEVQDTVVAPLTEKISVLTGRIEDLQAAVDDRVRQRTDYHHDLVEELATPTFEAVTNALAEANRIKALAGGIARVQANRDARGMWLQFRWGAKYEGNSRVEPNRLVISTDFRQDGLHQYGYEETWSPEESLADATARLVEKLRPARVAGTRNDPDLTLAITNLQRSLDLALPIAGSEWNLGGAALYERIGEDWAITDFGVEHRKLGLVLPRKGFPEQEYPFQLPGAKPKKPWNPTAPDGVDASEWRLVVERASRYLRPASGWSSLAVLAMGNGWVPAGAAPNIR